MTSEWAMIWMTGVREGERTWIAFERSSKITTKMASPSLFLANGSFKMTVLGLVAGREERIWLAKRIICSTEMDKDERLLPDSVYIYIYRCVLLTRTIWSVSSLKIKIFSCRLQRLGLDKTRLIACSQPLLYCVTCATSTSRRGPRMKTNHCHVQNRRRAQSIRKRLQRSRTHRHSRRYMKEGIRSPKYIAVNGRIRRYFHRYLAKCVVLLEIYQNDLIHAGPDSGIFRCMTTFDVQ